MEAIVHKIYVVVVHTTKEPNIYGKRKKALLILCPEDSLQYILSDPLSVQEESWYKAIAFWELQDDLFYVIYNLST